MTEERGSARRWRNTAFAVLSIALFVVGFPFLEGSFEAHVSRGLAFVLTTAVFMLVVPVLGKLLFPTQIPQAEDSVHPGLRALYALVAIVAFASWSALADIETNALSQPDHATGAFTIATHLKGVVRYMTPGQYEIDQVATWAFSGCVLLGFGLAVVGRLRRHNQSSDA